MTPAAKRKAWLGGFLVATLAAVGWVSQEDSTPAPGPRIAKPKPRVQPSGEGTVAQGSLDLSGLTRLAADRRAVTDVFGAKSFVPTPPPAPMVKMGRRPSPPPVAPPPPQAPPVPYVYMGRFLEDGKPPAVFLSRAERLLVARVGETVEGSYRVDAADGSSVRLVYLPLNETQTVAMAPAGPASSGGVTQPSAYQGAPQPNAMLQNFSPGPGIPEAPAADPNQGRNMNGVGGSATAHPPPVSGIETTSPSALGSQSDGH